MISAKLIFTLLVVYQIKHLVCDYFLQGQYMLGKFKPFPAFIMPLLAHSAVHGVATFAIVACYRSLGLAFGLAMFDMTTHFLVDRVKASPKLLGRFKALNESTYRMALRMSMGLSITDGRPMKEAAPQIDTETLKTYVALGNKDLRGNKFFWYSLGGDQMMHHLTHYVIIAAVLFG